uniref:Killer cell lectin-like receptor subfamily B member 1B allele B n=1 Tax=Lepisosteus oculatus TaxID=7918 RepID=W5MNK2_LEPOC|nr:PREDICTED: natural killer cells antigen CD94-like isoform X1 [Lepisosteus oculatus]
MAEDITYSVIGFSTVTGQRTADVTSPPTLPGPPPIHSSRKSWVLIFLGVVTCVFVVTVLPMGIALWKTNCEEKALVRLRESLCGSDKPEHTGQLCEFCPSGWVKGSRGNCYFISPEQKPWSSARQACSELGTDLLAIQDQAEMKSLEALVKDNYFYWIGLNRSDSSSEWRWVDGRALETAVSEVSVTGKGGDCAGGSWSRDNVTLFSSSCSTDVRWICERPPIRV